VAVHARQLPGREAPDVDVIPVEMRRASVPSKLNHLRCSTVSRASRRKGSSGIGLDSVSGFDLESRKAEPDATSKDAGCVKQRRS
jgi:hypothetical protein